MEKQRCREDICLTELSVKRKWKQLHHKLSEWFIFLDCSFLLLLKDVCLVPLMRLTPPSSSIMELALFFFSWLPSRRTHEQWMHMYTYNQIRCLNSQMTPPSSITELALFFFLFINIQISAWTVWRPDDKKLRTYRRPIRQLPLLWGLFPFKPHPESHPNRIVVL